MQSVILNVDDDEAGRFAVSHMLRTAGFDVLEAATGAEALECMRQTVDLVLLDVNLPDIDGFEVCRRIKSDPRTRTTTVIHLSASRLAEPDKVLGLDSGADAYLLEPIGRDELVATVQAHLRAKQLLEREARRQHEFERQLVGIVSHDLRTPLSAIHATAAALQKNADRKVAEAGDRIIRVSGRMARLVKELLDFTQARIGQGVTIHRRPVDLVGLLKRTIDGGVREAELGRDDTPAQLEGNWDEDRVEQMLANLIGNALSHSPTASTVRVALRLDGDDVVIAVANQNRDGPIPPALMRVLFEPFTRGPGESTEGVGLGLFIVHHLANAHGGQIAVKSDTAGTAFTLRLPRQLRD